MEKFVNVLLSIGVIGCGISVFRQAEKIGVEVIALLIIITGIVLINFSLKEKKKQY